jgi:hypothetical protein
VGGGGGGPVVWKWVGWGGGVESFQSLYKRGRGRGHGIIARAKYYKGSLAKSEGLSRLWRRPHPFHPPPFHPPLLSTLPPSFILWTTKALSRHKLYTRTLDCEHFEVLLLTPPPLTPLPSFDPQASPKGFPINRIYIFRSLLRNKTMLRGFLKVIFLVNHWTKTLMVNCFSIQLRISAYSHHSYEI